MTYPSYKVERIGFGLLLFIALLMAFEPLVRLHDPNGVRFSNAFSVPAGIRQLQAELRILAPIKSSLYSGPANGPTSASTGTPGPLPMPFSIQTASIIPWCIFVAFAFSLLALVDLLLLQKWFALLSLFGGFSGGIALVHVLVLSSDLEAWTDTWMSINELKSPGDSALSEQILMGNSIFVTPGAGLFVLTMCLLLVSVLSITRAVPRIRSVLRAAARIRSSNPIQVRPINAKYPAETCMTLDVSQTGLYVESQSNHYFVGMEVYLTRNAPAGEAANSDEHGYVVRVETKDSGCRFAIHLIPEAK